MGIRTTPLFQYLPCLYKVKLLITNIKIQTLLKFLQFIQAGLVNSEDYTTNLDEVDLFLHRYNGLPKSRIL